MEEIIEILGGGGGGGVGQISGENGIVIVDRYIREIHIRQGGQKGRVTSMTERGFK